MTRFILFLAVICSAEGALVRVPTNFSPFGGLPQTILIDNSGASIKLGSNTLCTHDIPISACYTTNSVRGTGEFEFLFAEIGGPTVARLRAGDELSDEPANGFWGSDLFNVTEFQISRHSPRNGTFSFLKEEFFIGFRVKKSEDEYTYGWVEIGKTQNAFGGQSESTSIIGIAYDSGGSDSLVVQPIPEPSVLISASGSLLLLLIRKRKNGTG